MCVMLTTTDQEKCVGGFGGLWLVVLVVVGGLFLRRLSAGLSTVTYVPTSNRNLESLRVRM